MTTAYRLALNNTHLINIHAWCYSLVICKPFLQVQIANFGYQQLKKVSSYRARFTHYQSN